MEGGKTDMERVALFKELGYVSIGDKYKAAASASFNESAGRGKQMLPGGAKTKNATQAGYFAEKFGRVMEGEGYSDPISIRRKQKLQETKKNITSKPFLPADGTKKQSGLGSYYGSIGGKIEYFAAVSRKAGTHIESKKNFYTNPAKKGTGFGYVDVTIGKYHPHQSSQYDIEKSVMKKEQERHGRAMKGNPFKLNMHPEEYFDRNPFKGESMALTRKKDSGAVPPKIFRPTNPGKSLGGCKSGTFDPYPKHSDDHYTNKRYSRPVHVVNKFGKIYYPPMAPKSKPQPSVVNYNVNRSVNATNYKSNQPIICY